MSDLINDENFASENDLAEVAFTGSYVSLSNTPQYLSEFENDTHYVDRTSLNVALARKQDELVSGVNIKSINNQSILGSGNLSITGGTPTDVKINGTSITSNNEADIITQGVYNSTTNKIATVSDLPTKTSDLTNDSNFISNVYSTTETIIDKWVDNKTLYRKCIYITMPDTTETSISTGLTNVNVINIYGCVSNGSSSSPINFYNHTYPGGVHCYTGALGSILYYGSSYNATSYSGYVILEYTKN